MARTLVVVSAGLGSPSTTKTVADSIAKAVEAEVTARGEALEIVPIELRSLAVELGQAMATGGIPTPRLTEAKELIAAADGIVAATPVFSASYSGLFKMFFDAIDPGSIEGTPVLLAATAGTPRHSLVIEHAMRPLFAYLRAVTVPTGVLAATSDFGGDEGAEVSARIRRAAGQLAALMVAQETAVAGFAQRPEDAERAARAKTRIEAPVTSFQQLLRGHAGDGR